MAIRIDSPYGSKPGLPARPHICFTSMTEIGVLPELVSKRLVSLTITLLAGRLIPAARVGVATIHFILPLRKFSSTKRLCLEVSPALWKAIPDFTHAESFLPNAVESPSPSKAATSSSVSSLPTNAFMLMEYFTASASVERLELTNIMHWPPSFSVGSISDHISSPVGVISMERPFSKVTSLL